MKKNGMKALMGWLWGVMLMASCTSLPENGFKDNGYQYISGQVLNFPEGKRGG